jgi:hypothetical protein
MADDVNKAVSFIIRKISEGWHIDLPDGADLGPYRNGELALEVAVTHVLLARKEGVDARMFVRDERGGIHTCAIVDGMSDPQRCQKCESSWQKSALPVKCPLREAIGAG